MPRSPAHRASGRPRPRGRACGVVDEVEERDLAGQRHPGQDRVVAEGQAGLGVDVREQGARRSPSRARRAPGRRSPPARPRAGAGPDRPPRPRRGTGGRPGSRARRRCPAPSGRRSGGRAWPGPAGRTPWCRRAVVEEAAVGPERHVEVAQPDQVDPRARQAIGQGVGPLAVEEGRRREQRDAEEPRPAPLRRSASRPVARRSRTRACPRGRRAGTRRRAPTRRRSSATGRREPARLVVLDVVGGPEPRRGLGGGGDLQVVDPDRAVGVQLLELEDRPDRPARDRDAAASGRQSNVPDQRKTGVPGPRPARSGPLHRGRPGGPRPPRSRGGPRPDGDRQLQRRERLDRHGEPACAPASPPWSAPGPNPSGSRGRRGGRPARRPSRTASGVAQLEVAVEHQVRRSRPPPVGTRSIVRPSMSSVPVAPSSPTVMMRVAGVGGTGDPLGDPDPARAHRLVPGPDDPPADRAQARRRGSRSGGTGPRPAVRRLGCPRRGPRGR